MEDLAKLNISAEDVANRREYRGKITKQKIEETPK